MALDVAPIKKTEIVYFTKHSSTIQRIEFEGHDYIIVFNPIAGTMNTLHDPSCRCHVSN